MDMLSSSLAVALEREHREIDAGIAGYAVKPSEGQLLARAIRALRRHIYLEEEILFPMLLAAEPASGRSLSALVREHARIWDLLEPLEHDLGTRPIEPARIRQLKSFLMHHNRNEEKDLYPRTDEVLPQPAADRMRAFLDSAELPEGWVCIKSRPASSRQAAAR